MIDKPIREAVKVLRNGGIIAYPTEAVYGLGCDPLNTGAITKLLALKQRQPEKGLILLAACYEQLAPFLADIEEETKNRVLATWPGHITWLWPARKSVSRLLRGDHATLAVRVTAHPLAAKLCNEFNGPLVSTSANISHSPAARTAEEVRAIFADKIDYILEGETGGMERPSEIRDARSGEIVRAG